jgi:hypothetical protein
VTQLAAQPSIRRGGSQFVREPGLEQESALKVVEWLAQAAASARTTPGSNR